MAAVARAAGADRNRADLICRRQHRIAVAVVAGDDGAAIRHPADLDRGAGAGAVGDHDGGRDQPLAARDDVHRRDRAARDRGRERGRAAQPARIRHGERGRRVAAAARRHRDRRDRVAGEGVALLRRRVADIRREGGVGEGGRAAGRGSLHLAHEAVDIPGRGLLVDVVVRAARERRPGKRRGRRRRARRGRGQAFLAGRIVDRRHLVVLRRAHGIRDDAGRRALDRREGDGRQRPGIVRRAGELHRRVAGVRERHRVGRLHELQQWQVGPGIGRGERVDRAARGQHEARRAVVEHDHLHGPVAEHQRIALARRQGAELERDQPVAHGAVVDRAHELRAGPVAGAAVRMHEEVLQRAAADMELREIDAAVQEGRQLAGGERRLDRVHGRHSTPSPLRAIRAADGCRRLNAEPSPADWAAASRSLSCHIWVRAFSRSSLPESSKQMRAARP